MKYKTCNFVHDTGYLCQSAAVGGRDYCCYHLRHRGRLMRMAQARARNQQFHLDLPPLENMHAVQSALSQVVEALAADMIDPKRAQLILSALRMAANNFKNADAWKPSAYINNHSATYLSKYDEFEAEYGLPKDIDLEAPPEVAFPPPTPVGAPPLSPAVGDRVGNLGWPVPAAVAGAGAFLEGANPPAEPAFRPDHPITPEMVEIVEISETEGADAAARRGNQLERNRQRRQQRADRKRYADIALNRNLQLSAQKIAAEKLAAEKAAAARAQPDPSETKKPPTRAAAEGSQSSPQEAKKTA